MWLFTVMLGLVLAGYGRAETAPQGNEPPGVVALEKVKVEIVGATFVTELRGVNAQYKEKQPEKYRGCCSRCG
jgi:hypothetical protein